MGRCDFVTLPGLSGSGAGHWQTLWELADHRFQRFQPESWDEPRCKDWTSAIKRAVNSCQRPPVLVAHSLACLAVAYAAPQICEHVAGAFLVAVPDPGSAAFPTNASDFVTPPMAPLPFPSLIVSSDNDPFAQPAHVATIAQAWGSGLISIGAHGHINSDSGLGAWPQGKQLLTAFSAGLREAI